MDNGRTTSDDDLAHGGQVLPGAMIACTFLGLLVAIGLMLRTNLDAAQSRPAAVTSHVPSAPALPAPVYQVGGDCSAGGIPAQWESRDGQLNCVARDQIRDAHRPGDDCSHDGVTASWQFMADRWVCVPQAVAPAPAPPQAPDAPAPPPAPEEYVPAPVEQPYIPPAARAPAQVYEPTQEPSAPEPAPAPAPVAPSAPAPVAPPAPPPPPAWLPQLPPLPWLPPGR